MSEEEYTCSVCDTAGTIEEVGFYGVDGILPEICEYCFLNMEKVTDD